MVKCDWEMAKCDQESEYDIDSKFDSWHLTAVQRKEIYFFVHHLLLEKTKEM